MTVIPWLVFGAACAALIILGIHYKAEDPKNENQGTKPDRQQKPTT
jgi:hypothetical protein